MKVEKYVNIRTKEKGRKEKLLTNRIHEKNLFFSTFLVFLKDCRLRLCKNNKGKAFHKL